MILFKYDCQNVYTKLHIFYTNNYIFKYQLLKNYYGKQQKPYKIV